MSSPFRRPAPHAWRTGRRLGCAAALVLLATGMPAMAQSSWLVTPEEAQASRSAPPQLTPRTVPVPGAPKVNLLSPDLAAAVPSPTRIQVRFEATAPAAIKPESFKVRYGALRLDITSRIASAAKVTAQGIDVPEAALPKGSHRLWIEVQDSDGRVGSRQVDFTVE